MDTAEIARLVAEADESFVPAPDLPVWISATAGLAVRFDETAAELSDLRDAMPTESWFELANRAMREAAVDTGALEDLYSTDRGFTLSVATASIAREQMEVEKGHDFLAHFDAQLLGFEMALDLATGAQPVSESFIRQLQTVICGGQTSYRVWTASGAQDQLLRHGEYKTHANHVVLGDGSVHSYAPVDETPHLMREFVETMQSEDFAQAHPVAQACYAHHTLSVIHPFPDGNGRTCRALASVFLLRSASIPLVIYADQKPAYLRALRSADGGALNEFGALVRNAAVTTMRSLAGEIEAVHDLDASGEIIRKSYIALNGASHKELDQMSDGLAQRLQDQLAEVLEDLVEELPNDVARKVLGLRSSHTPTGSWRERLDDSAAGAIVELAARDLGAVASRSAHVLIGLGSDPLDAFKLEGSTDSIRPVLVSLDEARSTDPTQLDRRLYAFARALVRDAMHELSGQLRERADRLAPPEQS